MVHQLGGSNRIVPCFQNGNAIFIRWPLNGLIRIVKSSGALWDKRMSPWRMHEEDLRRVLGYEGYEI